MHSKCRKATLVAHHTHHACPCGDGDNRLAHVNIENINVFPRGGHAAPTLPAPRPAPRWKRVEQWFRSFLAAIAAGVIAGLILNGAPAAIGHLDAHHSVYPLSHHARPATTTIDLVLTCSDMPPERHCLMLMRH